MIFFFFSLYFFFLFCFQFWVFINFLLLFFSSFLCLLISFCLKSFSAFFSISNSLINIQKFLILVVDSNSNRKYCSSLYVKTIFPSCIVVKNRRQCKSYKNTNWRTNQQYRYPHAFQFFTSICISPYWCKNTDKYLENTSDKSQE